MATKLPEPIQKRIDRMTPKQRQIALYGGIIAVMALIVLVFMGDENPNLGPRPPKPTTDILTDANPRSLGLDAVVAKTSRLESANRDLQSEVKSLKDRLSVRDKLEKQRDESELEGMRSALLEQLRAEIQQSVGQRGGGGDPLSPASDLDPFGNSVARPGFLDGSQVDVNAAPASTATPGGSSGSSASGDGAGVKMRDIGAVPDKVSQNTELEPENLYLPVGSMVSGTLITGMDAPTFQAARNEPYPALIKVDLSAILPMRRTLDLRECFALADGYGDLSSERAYLRGRTMSCIRDDGGSVEFKFQSYAVGEDGKVGMRGRLVGKQGRLLASAMAAGFMEGLSDVFRRQQVPVIASTSTGTAQYQSLLSQESAESALAQGSGEALDRLAQYYLELADQMHYVVEVDAGRRVDFVVTTGAEFPQLHES